MKYVYLVHGVVVIIQLPIEISVEAVKASLERSVFSLVKTKVPLEYKG